MRFGACFKWFPYTYQVIDLLLAYYNVKSTVIINLCMEWTAHDTDMDQFWSWRLLSYAAIVADVHLLDLQDLDSSIGLLPQPDGHVLRDEHPAHAHHALLLLYPMALQSLKPRDRSSRRSRQRTEVKL